MIFVVYLHKISSTLNVTNSVGNVVERYLCTAQQSPYVGLNLLSQAGRRVPAAIVKDTEAFLL